MSTLRRRTVLGGALALAAPAVHAQSGGKPYNGTTINCSCFQTTYYEYLKNYFPEFQEKTGIKVNFTMQAFPVYNQRTDLELSTKGSAIDACNITFIYSGRWIGAGWFTPLDPFLKDPKHTPADWDPDDFVSGAQSQMKNAKGETFAMARVVEEPLPWPGDPDRAVDDSNLGKYKAEVRGADGRAAGLRGAGRRDG